MQGCHLSCSLYGCKRTYTNPEALASHIQDHHRMPAQSLPGKSFLCSTIGCEASFSSMQQLMDHMRHHHKPNYFFLCESCRAKLRSYRTLLKHLQTCAKVAKKAAKSDPGAVPDMDPSGLPVAPMDMEHSGPLQAPVQPEHMQAAPLLSSNMGVLDHPKLHVHQPPANSASLEPTSARPLAEPLAALEPNKPQSVSGQPEASYSPFPPSLSPIHPATLPDLSQPEQQNQWSPRLGQAVLPSSPPGSNAVWRKNQGQSFSCRILWEHTRGRYSCLQCGHCTLDRKEMTAHIEVQHKSPGGKTNTDTDAVVSSPSPLVKSQSDSENSSYTQL
ncbi:zinc finger protein 414 [Salminus brasiliensis]|uniref:zinc finger protein 414 n=1 Tax=Salminus brasiliensis TaxID=930266 RepID=UPI003B82ED72